MDINIRLAEESDLQDITRIYNQGIADRFANFELTPVSEENRRQWLRDHDGNHPVLVAEVDGKVIGFAAINVFDKT